MTSLYQGWFPVLSREQVAANKAQALKEIAEERAKAEQLWHVTIFFVQRIWGGPEEGGWWFTAGEPTEHDLNQTFASEEEAALYLKTIQRQIAGLNVGLPELSSVLSIGRYTARISFGEPEAFPKEIPHYE